jgi:hypothetical protein
VDLSNNWFTGRIPDSFKALAHPGIKVSLNGNLLSCCGTPPTNLSVSTAKVASWHLQPPMLQVILMPGKVAYRVLVSLD